MNTSPHRFVAVCFVLFSSSCAQTTAKEANLQPLREILGPQTKVLEDATKWPKTVPVRSPDPIFGSASHLEVWSYDQRFAKRFEGFPEDQADPDMPAGLWAVVLRVYKQSYSPLYKDQKLYSCQIDLYLEDTVTVNITQDKSTAFSFLGELPATATELKAKENNDIQLLKAMSWSAPAVHLGVKVEHPVNKQMVAGLQFTDGKLRGILNTFGVLDYRKDFLKGMQLMRTGVAFGNTGCQIFYPIAKESKMIVRFGGADPYDSINRKLRSNLSSVGKLITPQGDLRLHPNLPDNGNWRWTPETTTKGLIALPEKLSKRGIEIGALVEDLNRCILDENMIQQGRYKADDIKKEERLLVCKRLREKGDLYYTGGFEHSGWYNRNVEWTCPDWLTKDITTRKANTEWCARANPR